MKKLSECPVCKSEKINFYFNQIDKNIGIQGIFSSSKCSNCKAIFLNPQPTYKESGKFYPNEEYYSFNKIIKKEDSIKTRIKLGLYKIYFSNGKNIFEKILFSPIKFFSRGTILNKEIRLLDIGCGSGQFLYEMKSLGLEVYGIEPGKFDKEENKKYNLNIKQGNIESVKYKKEYFDMITLNHVLEHINNPNETLSCIKRILKEEGVLIIGVPNTNSLAFKIFKKNWYQLDIPRHLINYSESNLKLLLEEDGFKTIKVRYNSRPSQFSVSLMYLIKVKSKIIKSLLDFIFLPLTWAVNLLRMGDQIEIWCMKKDIN
jgi:2-polyprenyl-3-methyl-5-hydroxy-6-metoxy-1,4-benzoquinol methylase